MSESETPRPSSDADQPVSLCEPRLRGPEIPNAEVDENGMFTVHIGDTEVFESARAEFFLGLGLDDERPIEWLWPERIPSGMLTVLEGASQTGKSFIVADMAARVSRGAPWPGRVAGPNMPGEVLFLCGDLDDWERTVFSRLKQAGADVRRIGRLTTILTFHPLVESRDKAHTQRPIKLPDDLGQLEYNIRVRPEVRLVVIDSLTPFCANDKAYRETLRQLNEIAARRNVAIVVASRPARQRSRNHLRPAVERRADAVRCAFNALIDLEDETLCYLAPARMTFTAQPQWLPYRIGASGIVWLDPIDAPPEASPVSEAVRERGALRREAAEWLQGALRGGPVSMYNILQQARELGYSLGTLRRVKAELKVRSKHIVLGEGVSYWAWVLGPPDPEEAESTPVETPPAVAEVSATQNRNGKTKPAARRKVRRSKEEEVPVRVELDADPEALESDLDRVDHTSPMTRKLITRIVSASPGMDEFGEFDEPTPPKRGNGKNGRHHSNGHDGSNGKGPQK